MISTSAIRNLQDVSFFRPRDEHLIVEGWESVGECDAGEGERRAALHQTRMRIATGNIQEMDLQKWLNKVCKKVVSLPCVL